MGPPQITAAGDGVGRAVTCGLAIPVRWAASHAFWVGSSKKGVGGRN